MAWLFLTRLSSQPTRHPSPGYLPRRRRTHAKVLWAVFRSGFPRSQTGDRPGQSQQQEGGRVRGQMGRGAQPGPGGGWLEWTMLSGRGATAVEQPRTRAVQWLAEPRGCVPCDSHMQRSESRGAESWSVLAEGGGLATGSRGFGLMKRFGSGCVCVVDTRRVFCQRS